VVITIFIGRKSAFFAIFTNISLVSSPRTYGLKFGLKKLESLGYTVMKTAGSFGQEL